MHKIPNGLIVLSWKSYDNRKDIILWVLSGTIEIDDLLTALKYNDTKLDNKAKFSLIEKLAEKFLSESEKEDWPEDEKDTNWEIRNLFEAQKKVINHETIQKTLNSTTTNIAQILAWAIKEEKKG